MNTLIFVSGIWGLVLLAWGLAVVLFVRRNREDSNLLDFLSDAGLTLNHASGRWAVTDAKHDVLGGLHTSPREAIRAAARALVDVEVAA